MEALKSNTMAGKASTEPTVALEQLKTGKKGASTMGRVLFNSGRTKLEGKTE